MLGTGWPAFAAIHSDLPPVAVHLLGLVTIGLGLVLYVLGAEICCTDGRLRTGATAPAAQPARTIEEARA